MYARFIPQPAGQTPSKRHEDAVPPKSPNQASSATVTEVAGAGFTYSRYIPETKASEATPQIPKIQRFDDEPAPSKPKRKRDQQEESQASQVSQSKKSKRAENADDHIIEEKKSREDAPKEESKKPKKNKKKTAKEGEAPDVEMKTDEKKKTEKKKMSREDSLDGLDSQLEQSETTTKESGIYGAPSEGRPKKEKRKSNKAAKEQSEDQEKTFMPQGEDVEMADVIEPIANQVDAFPTPEPEPESEKRKMRKEKKDKKKEKKKKDTLPQQMPVQEDQRHKTVLERKVKSLQFAEVTRNKIASKEEEPEEPLESHGLEPLPQPEPAPQSTEKPTYDTLPPWLLVPIRVSQDTRTPFTELGILPRQARILEEKGYSEAFAVQTAAVPLLLSSSKEQPGDVLISAATGSGKTLAYALPIARDISNNSVITRLRALVVLPTRELVKQAQEVFELCARAYEGEDRKRVRVGVAIGSQSLSSEQESLVGSGTRYDPEAYKRIEEQAKLQAAGSNAVDDLSEGKTPQLSPWEGQIIDFYSKVDVLICTPGRLVEHIEQTPGFTLDHIRWLVVDEADKLLAQSFQGWVDVVLEGFKTTMTTKFGARDFPDMPYSGVRKVILSATLTRDLSLLNQLALRRPRLIVLEGQGDDDVRVAEHSLPNTLREFAIRVHDANLKPLYLLDLLRGEHMENTDGTLEAKKPLADSKSDSSSSDSDSDSDSSSDSSSESESGSPEKKSSLPMSLIFTKSNESALRLSRLLTLLDPSLSTHINTLTSNTPTSVRRKTLSAFAAPTSPLRLVIASDLVARGIDIPKLAHVINYDLPPSLAGYVHRVGRTARAGRSGCAWTLVGDGESGWFWGKIAKGSDVKRAQKVERVRIEEMNEERIQEYEDALKKLGQEVIELSRR